MALAVLTASSVTGTQARSLAGGGKEALAEAQESLTPRNHWGELWQPRLISRHLAFMVRARCRTPGRLRSCRDELLVSRDLGHSWRVITPGSVPPGMPLLTYEFLDRRQGWLIANEVSSDALLFRTADGGRSWDREPTLPSGHHAGDGQQWGFLDALHGWRWIYTAVGESSRLSWTHDGGSSWSRRWKMPGYGQAYFSDREHGWVANLGTWGDDSFFTKDGGETWTQVEPPRRPHYDRSRRLGLPAVFADGTGVLPVSLRRHGRWDITFSRTVDAGHSWSVGPLLRVGEDLRRRGDVWRGPIRVSVVASDVWWVLTEHPPCARDSERRRHVAACAREARRGGADHRREWSPRLGRVPGRGQAGPARDGGRRPFLVSYQSDPALAVDTRPDAAPHFGGRCVF
jgi:photosystem II stability/assembly factor-like uncharacterized protein